MRIFERELSLHASRFFWAILATTLGAGVASTVIAAELTQQTRLSAKDRIAAVQRSTKDPARSFYLANLHLQKQLSCGNCHGTDFIPDANATAINAQCATCHGGLDQLAKGHKGAAWLNPHASHLGNIACSSCHAAHQESKPYCLNCHTNFKMPMPGAAAAKR